LLQDKKEGEGIKFLRDRGQRVGQKGGRRGGARGERTDKRGKLQN